jgi:hypothetical protein
MMPFPLDFDDFHTFLSLLSPPPITPPLPMPLPPPSCAAAISHYFFRHAAADLPFIDASRQRQLHFLLHDIIRAAIIATPPLRFTPFRLPRATLFSCRFSPAPP